MWHQLVLRGVGGRTIAEAKERITHAEFCSWMVYIDKHGPLDIAGRQDRGFAMLAALYARYKGSKVGICDFMPYAEEPAATPEQMLAALTGGRT